jgi:hypothetical protein
MNVYLRKSLKRERGGGREREREGGERIQKIEKK